MKVNHNSSENASLPPSFPLVGSRLRAQRAGNVQSDDPRAPRLRRMRSRLLTSPEIEQPWQGFCSVCWWATSQGHHINCPRYNGVGGFEIALLPSDIVSNPQSSCGQTCDLASSPAPAPVLVEKPQSYTLPTDRAIAGNASIPRPAPSPRPP